jgi:hypothetical protein
MVLFAPADPAAVEVPTEPPKPPTPRPESAASEADADAGAPSSQPLDEDLFSDLTLLAPQPPLDQDQHPQGQDQNHRPASPAPVSPPTAAALSRQPSSSALRKKKRAVRIGYGRSPQTAPALPPTVALATMTTTTTTTTAAAAAPVIPTASSSGSLPDALPHDAAPPIPSQYPDQLDNGGEEVGVAVDPDANSLNVKEDGTSLDVKEEAKEEAGAEEAGAAAVGIEERLALLRSQMSSKLDSIQHRAAAVAAKRRQLAGRQRKVAEDVGSAASKHKDLERELEEACEAEDFERAERISDSLVALEKEKDRLLTALRDAELDYDSVDLELQDVLESRITMEEEAAALLEQFAKVNKLHVISSPCINVYERYT